MAHPIEVLAEPNRRDILGALLGGEQSVGQLVDALGLPQPNISKHLKVLAKGGFVTVRRDANLRIYRLRPEPLREIDAWLQPFRRTWKRRLDALEAHLDTMEDK